MNLETTAQESSTHLLGAWSVSFAIHGALAILLFSFFPLFSQSPALPKEPFHWDVALVRSTEMAEETIRTAKATERTVPKQIDRAPIPANVNQPIRNEVPSKVASSIDRVASIEPLSKTVVEPESPPSIPASDASQAESVSTPTSEEPTPNRSQASDPLQQRTEPPIGSTTQTPPQLEATAAAPIEETTPPTEAAHSSPPTATASDTAAVSATRLDYGWLQQAIFRRLEELKRSSRPLLDESRPLKVTVKAVVSREGVLLDSAVVKSSGFHHIDQEAMALVQRAFPIELDRPLDRQQMAMRIPITYSRE